MKNLLAITLVVGALSFAALAQSSTSVRPRVAPTVRPTSTPPALGNDPNDGSRPGGPPVLSGAGIRPSAMPTATPADGEDDGVIRVETNLVTMPVSVLDRDGRFISGLQQKDFKIFENGVEQKVDYFQSVEQPFT